MGFKQRRAKTPPMDRNQTPVSMLVPQKSYQILKAKAEERGLPVSRLICYAIDNELALGEAAFNYEIEMPKTIFIERAYVTEAGRLLRYIQKYGAMSLDQILLARRDIGLATKEVAMLAARELMTIESLVRYVYPSWVRYFKFNKDYRVIAPVQSHDDKKAKLIAEAEKELARLKGETHGEHIRQTAPTGPLGEAYTATENGDEEVTD